ncbi:hypothetical protein ACQ858_06625 [Variovorax ureilyticus]|uniref:hypothetical protein n=1 Tax=Variovorax ureilyticus TaxID=1836198 RepID=UPI003D67CA43
MAEVTPQPRKVTRLYFSFIKMPWSAVNMHGSMRSRREANAMAPDPSPSIANPRTTPELGSDEAIPILVAEVFEEAPPAERCSLVEMLMRPLGVLSLVAIANGIFAKIRFRSAGQEPGVRFEDIQNVHAADVVALVHHAQQVSVETVDGLAQLLVSSPGVAGSAAATLLIALLVRRARSRSGLRGSSAGRLADLP